VVNGWRLRDAVVAAEGVGRTEDPALARQLRELAALHESLRALTSTLELPEILRTVLVRIRTLTAAQALSLLLYDRERDELVFAATETLDNQPLVGKAPADEILPGESPTRIVLPLWRNDRLAGHLVLEDPSAGAAFAPGARARVTSVTADLDCNVGPGTLSHDTETLHRFFARVTAAAPCRSATLALYDPQGRPLVFRASRALQPGVIDGVRLPLDRGIAGWVARHREAVCLEDASADPRHDPTIARRTGIVPRGMLCVPLVHRERLLGVVQVINRYDGGAFTPEELRLVQSLADHAAIAVANAQLYREAEVASLTDDLTGLGNTRRFHRALPALLAQARPLSLIVLDLDHLKEVVDTHGHLVGSRTIATVGRLIAEHIRPGDVAARFGGDEFVAVLPSTDTAPAREVADRIRAAVAACARPDGLEVDIRHVTASLGVATAPTHATDPDGLFRAADAAMYAVKRRQRNGVAVAGSEVGA